MAKSGRRYIVHVIIDTDSERLMRSDEFDTEQEAAAWSAGIQARAPLAIIEVVDRFTLFKVVP